MSDKPASLGALLQIEIPRLYAFAYHMTGSRDDARGHVRQLVKAVKVRYESKVMGAENPSDTILGLLAQQMEESLGRRSEFTFGGLDNVLRSDSSICCASNPRMVSDGFSAPITLAS